MELQTKRLILKPIAYKDSDIFIELQSSKEVRKYIPLPAVTTQEQFDTWWNQFEIESKVFKMLRWVSYLDNKKMGMFTIKNIENKRGELGYSLLPKYWGKGYSTEACKRILDYCFNELELETIYAHTHPANQPSQRVLQKLGFEQQPIVKDAYLINGRCYDAMPFELKK